MKKFILSALVALFCITNVALAQDLKELKKLNKAYMKELKSQGYKSVKIQTTEDEGFWYFSVRKKINGKWLYGVFSKDKEKIFDCKYTNIDYIAQIEKDGYKTYTYNAYGGGTYDVYIYNYAMPGHFILYDTENKKTSIALVDGSIIKESSDDLRILGSWIFTNSKNIYTKKDNSNIYLVIDHENNDMGLMTWDGKTILKNENFRFEINSHINDWANGVFVKDGKHIGGFFLEDLSVIAPTVYNQMVLDFKERVIEVKLSPTDAMHVYNPDVEDNFKPKNKGEELYSEFKFKECIEYYAKEGVADPDSKFYSAHSMYLIASTEINNLKNYISAPSGNTVYGYNYDDAKSLLEGAIKILSTAAIQDTLREDVYKENLQIYYNALETLEENHPKLLEIFRQKENSFGNRLANSVLTGLVNGLTNAAIKSIEGSSSSKKTVSSPNVAKTSNASNKRNVSPVSSSSESDNEESDKEDLNSKPKAKQYRECAKCRGKGELFSTTSNATYGNDKKVVCSVCGQEHWLSIVHHHKKCSNCNGTGKVEM